MASPWKWYAVQTLYRTVNTGRPQGVDPGFSSEYSLVEVRVVLFRARSFDEAITKAEADAKRYARDYRHRNRYGQKVITKFLGYSNAFELLDPPKPGTEVFSSTELVPQSQSRQALVARLIGANSVTNEAGLRLNFTNILFSGTAPRVKPTRSERREYERLRRPDV